MKISNGVRIVMTGKIIDIPTDRKIYTIYDHSYCILPRGHKLTGHSPFIHNVNITDDEALLDFVFFDEERIYTPTYEQFLAGINNILFDTKTLSTEIRRINFNLRFCDSDFRMYLMNRKQYLVFWRNTTFSEELTYLIRVPDLMGFTVNGFYKLYDTPRFLIMFQPKTSDSLIFDSEDDSMWSCKFENKNQFMTFRNYTMKSLRRLGIVYDTRREIYVDHNGFFTAGFSYRHDTRYFKYYDYDKLNRSRKFREFTDFILQNRKKYHLHWYSMDPICELVNINVNEQES